jgi:class 3 adenylate cyclase/pimeloyl-ACP methyl ester carboxylesterase
MESQIQYVRTADDVNIACSLIGDGPAFVVPPPAMPWSHLQLEWEIPEWRGWSERLAGRARLVRYDARGSGLSDRDVTDLSLDANVRDLEAVVDGLGLARVALFGCYFASPVAIAYAARHPERVSHLVLWCGFASSEESQNDAQRSGALRQLLDVDYSLFTETLSHTVFGWAEGVPAHRVAVYMQQALTPDLARLSWMQNDDVDLTAELPRITAPTLVMHRRDFPFVSLDIARRLAARIPGARLAVIEGSSISPYIGDVAGNMEIIFEFLGIGRDQQDIAHTHEQAPGAFRTILFSDIENSSAITQRLGDVRAREIIRAHETIVRDALSAYGGAEVKTMGDGFMASFSSATSAVRCAIAIQRGIEAMPNSSATATAPQPDDQLRVRIGLNAGEPIEEHDDLFGTSVNLAARIAAKAHGGEILASDVVRQLVAGKGLLFADRGDTVLRGFEDPVRLYEVRWQE